MSSQYIIDQIAQAQKEMIRLIEERSDIAAAYHKSFAFVTPPKALNSNDLKN